MSNERAWPFPASRPLATWWRQLTRWQPRSLWIAHLLLHRVEALVALQQTCQVDPADRLILKAIALAAPASLESLESHLCLGRQLLLQVLRGLEKAGLAASAGGWSLTPLGQQASAAGQYPCTIQERRSFTFLDHDGGPPTFVSFSGEGSLPWSPEADWSFDPAVLDACIARPDDWKRRVGFPLEITGLVRLDGGQSALERVVIDRPEKLTVALTPTTDGRLLGFAIKEDTWTLQADVPLFELTEWTEAFPELAEPAPAEWRQAWDDWCQSRKMTIEGAVDLQAEGQVLRVRSSLPLREQFGKRSDVLKGEAWLLVGGGRVRRGMAVEVE